MALSLVKAAGTTICYRFATSWHIWQDRPGTMKLSSATGTRALYREDQKPSLGVHIKIIQNRLRIHGCEQHA